MTKLKTFSWLGATGLLLSLASCSNDDLSVPTADDITTFSISLPAEMGTRAFGDGSNATDLKVAIYQKGQTNPLMSKFDGGENSGLITVKSLGSGQFTVSAKLAIGEDYEVVFWAQNPTCSAFTFNPAGKSMSVDYSKMNLNDEKSDAFYNYVNIKGGTDPEETIYLKRPFAQVNIGATDYQEFLNAGGTAPTTCGLSFTNIYSTFGFEEGAPVGTAGTVTYPQTILPSDKESFPGDVTNVNYLAMGYILVGNQSNPKDLTQVTLTVPVGSTTLKRVYQDVPVQSNYRTNIYGRILTNINEFNVTVEPSFSGIYMEPEEDIDAEPSVWDGKTYTEPKKDANGNYLLNSAEEFAYLPKMTGINENTKFILMTDVDLNEKSGSQVYLIKGEFDGNGHTVSGIAKQTLFNNTTDFYLHDLNVVATSTSFYSPVIEAAGNNTRVSNVTLKATQKEDGTGVITFGAGNGSIGSTSGTGGIIGYTKNTNGTTDRSSITIENCINYADFKASGLNLSKAVGGILGYAGSMCNVTITGCKNYGYILGYPNLNNFNVAGMGGILGCNDAITTIDDCTNEGNIKMTNTGFAGGIMGYSGQVGFTISNCTNSGDIQAYVSQQRKNGENYMIIAGGIYGGSKASSYGSSAMMKTISECTNTGTITASAESHLQTSSSIADNTIAAGGIVGYQINNKITVEECINSGDLVTSIPDGAVKQYQYRAGIINVKSPYTLIVTDNICENVSMTGKGTTRSYSAGIYLMVGSATQNTYTGNVNKSEYQDIQ